LEVILEVRNTNLGDILGYKMTGDGLYELNNSLTFNGKSIGSEGLFNQMVEALDINI